MLFRSRHFFPVAAFFLATLPVHAQAPAATVQTPAEPAKEDTAAAQIENDNPTAPQNSPDAEPAPKKRRRFQLGPEIGLFRPTDALTRARFGGTKTSIGVGFTALRIPTTKGAFGFDGRLIYLSDSPNRVLYVPIGAEYRRALAEPKSGKYGATPYAGATVNVVPTRLKSVPEGIDEKFKVALGASAFLGVSFGEKAYLEARYLGVSKVRGFDLSGASIGAGYRF